MNSDSSDSKAKGTALITGGSRGIGAATALRLAKDGYNVAINYLNSQDEAERVAASCEAFGVQALCIAADVSDEKQIKKMFSKINRHWQALTVLVNNAGVLAPQMRLQNMTAKRMEKIFQVNVIASMLCCKEAITIMSGGSGGVIVNVSSVAAKFGSPFEYIDYAASKGAIDTLTVGLSKEVAEHGIRVNGVRPGYIYTDMHADGGESNRVDRLKKTLPLKRGGQPEEVAAVISWLVSHEASYLTGTIIDVAGGG